MLNQGLAVEVRTVATPRLAKVETVLEDSVSLNSQARSRLPYRNRLTKFAVALSVELMMRKISLYQWLDLDHWSQEGESGGSVERTAQETGLADAASPIAVMRQSLEVGDCLPPWNPAQTDEHLCLL
jgi:hypothetical protein